MTNIETNNNNTANEDQLLSLFAIEELEERLEFKEWKVSAEYTYDNGNGSEFKATAETTLGNK